MHMKLQIWLQVFPNLEPSDIIYIMLVTFIKSKIQFYHWNYWKKKEHKEKQNLTFFIRIERWGLGSNVYIKGSIGNDYNFL